jgi:AbiTii-like protein
MDSLVIQLQREGLDSSSSTLDIMRKALVVAKKLGLAEFQKWIDLEMGGYKIGDEIPDYRAVSGQVKAFNPYYGWIDAAFSDPQTQSLLSTRHIGQPIGELETLSRHDKNGNFHVPFDPQTEHNLMEAAELPFKPTLEVSFAAVTGILDKVRNIVLNWCLDLEANGILGEGMTFSEKEKQIASGTNYHVHFHGPVGTSQIQQGAMQSSQEITTEVDLRSVDQFIEQLRREIPTLSLELNLQKQIAADLRSIEAQLAMPKPNPGVIAECLRSVRSVLEGCVGSMIASGLLQLLSTILPK